MKSQTKINRLLAIAFALFMFGSVATKAQCSKIVNNTNCSFKIEVNLYDKTVEGCNHVCHTIIAILPANSSFPILCGGCTTVCNIAVSIVTINGVSLFPPVTADYFNGAQALPPNGCGAAGIKYNPAMPVFEIF